MSILGTLDDEGIKALKLLIEEGVKTGQRAQTLWFKVASGFGCIICFLGLFILNEYKVKQDNNTAAITSNRKNTTKNTSRLSVMETRFELIDRINYKVD